MMPVMERFRDAVNQQISNTLTSSAPFAHTPAVSPADFLAPAVALGSSGKRTRALFVLAGWQAGSGLNSTELEMRNMSDLPVGLAAAVELYQLSALIHDDVIDAACTRRGLPTAHESFSAYHRAHNLLGSPEAYGRKMALLLGDYVLSLACLALNHFLSSPSAHHLTPQAARQVHEYFHTMTAEVAFGQYLDMHAEFMPLTSDSEQATKSAFAVLLHKSAHYSVVAPTLLGALSAVAANPISSATFTHSPATLAGTHHRSVTTATSSITAELEQICTPLGEAFQLRDDALGVFGQPTVTGKPAGGDIVEGKRTVLLSLTRANITPDKCAYLDKNLGQPLTEEDHKNIQAIIRECGAYEQHEQLIAQREAHASSLIDASKLSLTVLAELASELSGRHY